MAYSPSEKYPGAVDVDPDYQGGKFRDNNPSTTNNGSPLKAIDRNELLSRDEAIMNDAGFEYNGLPDTPQDSQLFKAYKASLGNGANLLSNHNFLIQTPDDSQPLPSATPTSYPPGYQIFSGVFANETTGITNLTYIDGRVSFSGGDLYLAVPNTGGVERLTEFSASVADFDGKPRTRGVSFALVGDEYRVTVGIDALEDVAANPTPLGSVKFEQGVAATGHDVNYGVVASGSETARSLESRFSDILNIKDYYAPGDDDDAAIAKAVSVGKKVYLPDGDYNFSTLINADLYAGNNVTFSGRSQPVSSLNGTTELSAVRVDMELPIKPFNYDSLISTYGYSFIYPQAFYIDDTYRQVFVSFSAVGGSNNWGWIWVYDLDTSAYITHFSAGGNNSEGVYVRESSGVRRLQCGETFSQSGTGTTGTYILPSDLTTIEGTRLNPDQTSNTGQSFKLCGYGNTVLIETSFDGTSRSLMTYFRSGNLKNGGSTIYGYANAPRSILTAGKSQTYALGQSGILVGAGGFYPGSGDYTTDQSYASYLLNHDGSMKDSFVSTPIFAINSLTPALSLTPTRLENEGSAFSYITGSEKMYTLQIFNSAADAGADQHGIAILEVGCDPSLATSISLVSGAQIEGTKSNNLDTLTSYYNKSYNPATNEIMTSWGDIVDYMKSERVSEYTYYNQNDGDTTDINGNNVQGNVSVKVETGNFLTFFVTVYGFSTNYLSRISGSSGSYVQDTDRFIFNALSLPVRPEYEGRRFIMGRDGLPNINCYSEQTASYTGFRFYGGTSPILVGNINWTNTGTTYATTSDPRTKTEFLEHNSAWDDFAKIKDACGVFEFKHATGTKVVGFDAHKIIDAGINAGVEGEGPRDLSVGETYAEHWVINKDGEEELVKFEVTPASVDQSKIVPYLVSVIHDLNERLKTLESK